MTAILDDVDVSIKAADVAAVEAYLRCRIASPLKSSFKPREVGAVVGLSPQQAGSVLAAIARQDDRPFEMEQYPGGRGGTRWVVTRPEADKLTRRWWIEHGERTAVGGA